MSDNALYFPYINVPNSTWFSRLLLYWDNVSAIIPYEYKEDPGLLGQHTRDLLRANLVEQLWPDLYLGRIPRFDDDFLEHLHGLGEILEVRILRFAKTGGARIHFEKLAGLGEKLQKLGLARRRIYTSWFEVEVATADEFMAYLASCIAREYGPGLSPVTDDVRNLSPFLSDEIRLEATLEPLRVEALKAALPAPRGEVNIDDIRRFKDQHHKKLSSFRYWLETELGNLAAIADANLLERQRLLLNERIKAETDEIKAHMREKDWLDVVCGDLCGVVGALPVIGAVPKIVSAFYKVLRRSPNEANSPLAYAAWAQKELGLGYEAADRLSHLKRDTPTGTSTSPLG